MGDGGGPARRDRRARGGIPLHAFLVGFALQILATEIPFLHGVFGTVQLRFVEWLSLVLFAMLPLVFHEIFVLVRKLRKN